MDRDPATPRCFFSSRRARGGITPPRAWSAGVTAVSPYRVLFVGKILDAPGLHARVYVAPGRPSVVLVRRVGRRGAVPARTSDVAALAHAVADHLGLAPSAGLVWIEAAPGADGRLVVVRFPPGRLRRGRAVLGKPTRRLVEPARIERMLGRPLDPRAAAHE